MPRPSQPPINTLAAVTGSSRRPRLLSVGGRISDTRTVPVSCAVYVGFNIVFPVTLRRVQDARTAKSLVRSVFVILSVFIVRRTTFPSAKTLRRRRDRSDRVKHRFAAARHTKRDCTSRTRPRPVPNLGKQVYPP